MNEDRWTCDVSGIVFGGRPAGAGAGRRAAAANGRGRAVHLTARQMQNVTVDGKSGDDGDATIVYDRVSEAVRSLASAATKYAFLTPPRDICLPLGQHGKS